LMLGCALSSLSSALACGGTTGDQLGRGNNETGGAGGRGTGGEEPVGSGGAAGDGSARGAGGKGGAGRGGMGSGGRAGTGGTVGAGGVVETGGRAATGGRPDGMGGVGGVPSWSCRAPYKPPGGGPREDGPANPGMSCETLPDSIVLERYADETAKVPTGFFYEEPGEIVRWDLMAGCSPSLGDTIVAARKALGGNPDVNASTPFFHEAGVCNGEARTRYRRIRCDYYDGMKLRREPTGGVDDLLFWSGLMWFAANHDLGGNNLISGSMTIGDATDTAEICTTKTTYGDFGLCDTITLTSTKVRGSVDGTVVVDTITDERTIKGKCH